jgi:RNA polymerase sigma-70 factor (ECF subfamily)
MKKHVAKPARSSVEEAETPVSASAELARVFNQIREELVGTLWYLLGNREDALDASQETFLKCLRTQASLGDVQNLRAWIFRVALNTATDIQRSAWRRKARPLAEGHLMQPANTPTPGVRLEQQEDLDRLRRALLDLRQEEREVFLLRQNGELTYEQIAELRSVPLGTVKTHMRSAVAKLRKVLDDNTAVEAVPAP